LNYDGISDQAHKDAIAEFERDLNNVGNLWSALDEVQKLEVSAYCLSNDF
jgi:hypothetical protein